MTFCFIEAIHQSIDGNHFVNWHNQTVSPFVRFRTPFYAAFCRFSICTGLCLFFLSVCFFHPAMNLWADESDPWTVAALQIRQSFEALDRNNDRSLELEEYLGGDPDRRKGRRDFLLFDFDKNSQLSVREYAAIPGLVEATYRGAIPDPFGRLMTDAISALDEAYGHWEKRPDEQISAHTFVGNFLGSITPVGNRFVTGRLIDRADQNLDGKVGRGEAKHFLEQQLGMRLKEGNPLRDPTGRLVLYGVFIEIDLNSDGLIDKDESDRSWGFHPSLVTSFELVDHNNDSLINYDEFADGQSGCYFDPIEWFRDADRDFNGRLSHDELDEPIFDFSSEQIRLAMNGFDDDGDQYLNLGEFLISPLGNRNYPWHRLPLDRNGDQFLTYDEFIFDEVDLFQLQRRFYFHRYDIDSDGKLSTDEFAFSLIRPMEFVVSDRRGTMNQIYQSERTHALGRPSLHRGSGAILFHQGPSNDFSSMKIFRLSLDGGGVRAVCAGMSPSWSPSGDRFVCERRLRGEGIWLMDATGLSGRRLSSGRSPSWSPDGEAIAFIHQHGVWVYQLSTGETHQLFRRDEHKHRNLSEAVFWSPDAEKLVWLGHSEEFTELFEMKFAGSSRNGDVIRHRLPNKTSALFAWTDSDGILLRVAERVGGDQQVVVFQDENDLQDAVPSFFTQGRSVESGVKTSGDNWILTVRRTEFDDSTSSPGRGIDH